MEFSGPEETLSCLQPATRKRAIIQQLITIPELECFIRDHRRGCIEDRQEDPCQGETVANSRRIHYRFDHDWFTAPSIGYRMLYRNSCIGASFEVGVALRDVTPSPLLPVSGGIGPSHPAKESRGALSVRAMAIGLGRTKVVFVSSDFLGFPSVLGDRVREKVDWIPGDHILIGATHTHSAPDCYGFPDGAGGHGGDAAYWDFVCSQMAAAIRSAITSMQPATIRIQTGEATGKIAYNYYAEQLYDPRCSVIQAVNGQHEVIATLVNYAVHPEVLGSNVGICSPDLVWPLTERIEEKVGGVALFMNGAQGGMVTADNRQPGAEDMRTWEECLRIGQRLADEALRIIDTADQPTEAHLKVHARQVAFPVDSEEMRAVLEASPWNSGSIPAIVSKPH